MKHSAKTLHATQPTRVEVGSANREKITKVELPTAAVVIPIEGGDVDQWLAIGLDAVEIDVLHVDQAGHRLLGALAEGLVLFGRVDAVQAHLDLLVFAG